MQYVNTDFLYEQTGCIYNDLLVHFLGVMIGRYDLECSLMDSMTEFFEEFPAELEEYSEFGKYSLDDPQGKEQIFIRFYGKDFLSDLCRYAKIPLTPSLYWAEPRAIYRMSHDLLCKSGRYVPGMEYRYV